MAKELTTDVAKQIAADLKASAAMVEAPAVERIRMSPKGFTLPDGTTGDSIKCVILGFASANAHYPNAYDPDNPAGPDCWAVGYSPNQLSPHDSSEKKYSDTCMPCPNNQFGSAKVGAGKACKNTRKLAVLQLNGAEDASLMELSIPPSSIKYFDTYVSTTLRNRFQLPPSAVVTEIFMDEKVTYAAPRFKMDRPLDEKELQFFYSRKAEADDFLIPGS